MTRIEGKVAQIISDQELVINRGSKHGVKLGMRFRILHNGGADILDPDTGENLGSVELDKTIVKITSMSDKLAVGRTFRTITEEAGKFSAGETFMREFRPRTTSVETLRSGGRNAKNDLSPEDSIVKIGDRAVQFISDEVGPTISPADK